ncbi:MAG TPA: MFS transporter, partial [Stellaceae bacterium]
LGSVLSGQAIARLGIGIIVGLNAALLAMAALGAARVPRLPPRPAPRPTLARHGAGGIGPLLHLKLFRRLLLAAALILGSHAMHDSFAVIRWGAAGIGPDTAGLLWSEQVVAEVAVFLFLGRRLLDWLGTAGAAALAAVAGVVRWAVMAQTVWLPAMAMIEPLHGLTFALLHLAAMRLLSEIVPPRLAATALTLYGTVAIGGATALLTLASGPLYARFGAQGFWVMAVLCALAVPVAWTLREPIPGR